MLEGPSPGYDPDLELEMLTEDAQYADYAAAGMYFYNGEWLSEAAYTAEMKACILQRVKQRPSAPPSLLRALTSIDDLEARARAAGFGGGCKPGHPEPGG